VKRNYDEHFIDFYDEISPAIWNVSFEQLSSNSNMGTKELLYNMMKDNGFLE
jgi:hypothetical protein